MDQYQRTPQQIRDLVAAEIRAHTQESVAVPLPVPVDGHENGANWQMKFAGDVRFAEVFYSAVRRVQRRWDAFEAAGATATA